MENQIKTINHHQVTLQRIHWVLLAATVISVIACATIGGCSQPMPKQMLAFHPTSPPG